MLTRKLNLLPFVCWLMCGLVWAQEPQTLVSGQTVEREFAGDQSHTYQIPLTAGQFVRFRLDQRVIDAALILSAPDGKQLAEMNLTGAGSEESLALEVTTAGSYRLTVRGGGPVSMRGSYRLEALFKAETTAQDRKRITAEALMVEANQLVKQAGETSQQIIEKLEQALHLWQELGEPSWAAVTLHKIGNVHFDLRQNQKAIGYFDQALPLYREVKNRNGEGATLYNLGVSYGRLGQYEKTLELQEQAVAIYREMKNRAQEGRALGGVGVAYVFLGRYEKAIEYLEQALPIYREANDRGGEGLLLNNLAGSLYYLGRHEKAIEYTEQALAISREVNNKPRQSMALQGLGANYVALGQYEKAIDYYEQALPIIRQVNDRRIESSVVSGLAEAYFSLGQTEKAIEYYKLGLAAAREVSARGMEIEPLLGLGDVYHKLGKHEEAARAYEQSFRLARELKTRDHEASALGRLMSVWRARNLTDLAIYFGKQSVNVYQEIRSNLRSLDAESQRSFLKSKEQTYRQLADLLIAQSRLPEAEQVIRMLKEEEYFDYIRRDEANSPKAGKAALTPEEAALDKRYREVADKLTEIGTERGTLIDKKARTPEDEQRLAKLEADLVVAGNAFQKFLDGLAAEMGNNADTNARAFQLRESQGLMEDLRELGKGVVALYTLVGEDKYRVILTTADFQKGYEYPIKAEELNRKVLAFRDVLQNPKLDPLPLAQELYKILVGPVAKDLQSAKAQMVMWSLDGVLRYLPVAALHDGRQYLVERYRTAVFTPASQSRLRVEPSRKWTALGLGVTKAHGPTIPALPGVLEEIHGIIQEAGTKTGVLPGSIKLDEAFTQEAMLNELRKRNPVVHIASHFRFEPGNETNSALLLGDGTFLSLAQIKSLPNVFAGVDLLTLSACNTATGGSGATGKEVEGFGVLAQRQGAKAVIASLWPVADRSTKNLMQELYKLREAKADVTKVEALRQAQIHLLRGELQVTGEMLAARSIVQEEDKTANLPKFKVDPKAPYAHPYYWAPFILIGNWK
jgi:CHAT domain-containing protein/Flp pilus assembly protein TadD